MSTITLVTGNSNKLRELQTMVPESMDVTSHELDLPEIQSLDLQAIAEDKVKRAYDVIKGPVIIEDVAAGLDGLAGLSGPFYKFFREKMGDEILVKLAAVAENPGITVQCTAAYYDGERLLFGIGLLKGTVVESRGSNGFGFDPVIIPEGEDRTMAEMTAEEKNALSHRGLAFRDLISKITPA